MRGRTQSILNVRPLLKYVAVCRFSNHIFTRLWIVHRWPRCRHRGLRQTVQQRS